MMDDETSWQDAAPAATDMPLIGPVRPDEAGAAPDDPHDYDDLESGIASIFAAIQAAGEDDASGHDAAGQFDEDEAPAEAHTFQLLSELDRLWQRPSP